MKKRQPSVFTTIVAIILIVLTIILAFVASPLLALLIGMAIGYILELFTGDYLVRAAHAIGLTGVQDGDLPKVFGLLSVVAMFIKTSVSNALSTRERGK